MSQLELSRTKSCENEQLVELVDEITAVLQAGQPLDIDDYFARYPEYTDRLESWLQAMTAMADLGDSLAIHHGDDSPRTVGEHSSGGVTGTLGDYRILGELGRGGMGIVYEAEQISLGRRVAVKVLPFAAMLDKQQLTRFRNEARAAATLDHPNIVAVHSVGSAQGVHYYVMQLVEGQSLAEAIEQLRSEPGRPNSVKSARNEGRDITLAGKGIDAPPTELRQPASNARPIARRLGTSGETKRDAQAQLTTLPAYHTREYYRAVARLGVQAATALDHAHQHGIVHRDVKPGNFLLDDQGNLWVTDFGLARIETEEGMTMTGDLLGTLRYMSPEQALAKRDVVDHRADIYSLGATLHELLVLHPVYAGKDRQEILRKIAWEDPRPLRQIDSRIPVDLETIVSKAMEKNPTDRYATAQELANDLQRFTSDETIHARRTAPQVRLRKWMRRHKTFSVVTLVAMSLISLTTGVVWFQQQRQQAATEQSLRESLAAASTAIEARDYPLALQKLDLALGQLDQSNLQAGNLVDQIQEMHGDQARYQRFMRVSGNRLLERNGKQALKEYEVLNGPDWLTTVRKSSLHSAQIEDVQNGVLLALLGEADHLSEDKKTVDRALLHLERVAALDVLNRAYYLIRSQCYETLGDEEAAAADIRRAEDTPAVTSMGHQMLSTRHIWGGRDPDYVKGIEHAREAIRLDPAVSRFHIGYALWAIGNYEESVTQWSTELLLRPDSAICYVNRAASLVRLNRYQDALADCNKAVEVNPRAVYAYTWRGHVHKALKQYDLALADYEKASSLEPHDGDMNNASEAIQARGNYYLEKREYEKALADFNRAIEISPDYAQMYWYRGDLQSRLEEHEKAVLDFDKAIDLDPLHSARPYIMRCTSHLKLGNFEQAALDLATAKDHPHRQPRDLHNVCFFLTNWPKPAGRDVPQALKFAEELVELPTASGADWSVLGQARYRTGDHRGAVEALEKSIELDLERKARSWFFLAMAHWKLNHHENA